MLELKNIYKTFNPGTINEKVALNGLNLTLNEGDFVTVIGGNGAGKSTMLKQLPAHGRSTKDRSLSMVSMSPNYPNTKEPHISVVYSRIL